MIYFGNLLNSHNQECQITAVCCILYSLQDGNMSMQIVYNTDFLPSFTLLLDLQNSFSVNWVLQQVQTVHANKQRYHWAQSILCEFPRKSVSSAVSAVYV